ncbi:response regulator transcription factor [Shewanella sp. NIFS-20-20]|uniref:response regulator transcription factor n=1 Tax=Shewanella sp. NIFS-20-20 TaxID=2853806 RepID=UPI001C454FEC|nr:response regulator [Shewanella sp. NIFS-20-20]MBV7315283.1 response regulator [Shewanella sp. NIFS-20-20]
MHKLLIIEDDIPLANVLQRRLSGQGFECHHVDCCELALSEARLWQPSHILLDMKIGRGCGLDLIPLLRTSLPKVHLVLLTGYASIATAVEAIRQGADNYLAKPVDTATLVNALLPGGVSAIALPAENALSPKRVEWEHIQQVLTSNQGNVSATARQLGMHRRTLQRKLLKKPILS